jgi:hypothetical protein
MISLEIKHAVVGATVRFPERGQGVLVPGQLILTAAHVIEWRIEGAMALGDDEEFLQTIEAGGRALLVYPWAVESQRRTRQGPHGVERMTNLRRGR